MSRIFSLLVVVWRTTIVLLVLGVHSPGQDEANRWVAPGPEEAVGSEGTRVNWLYGAYVPRDVALRTLTNHERGQLYLRQTFLPWGIYLKTGIFSLGDQAKGSPRGWVGGIGGYGKRFASRYGQFAIQNTLTSAGNLVLGYEPRYERCRCSGTWPRIAHVVARNFITYNRTEHERRPQIALYAGAFGAGALSSTWKPDASGAWTQGYDSVLSQVVYGVVTNALGEFAPDMKKLLNEKEVSTGSAPSCFLSPFHRLLGGKMRDLCIHRRALIFRFAASLIWLLLALTGVCSARDKTDVVQFTNGDRITCEIIKQEKGYLYVKLDYVDGTVAIDWSKIARVESSQSFVVADKTGERYTGSLETVTQKKADEELKVRVSGASTSPPVPGTEVVAIGQTETRFWQNLHGALDSGFSYSKQDSRTQYNLDADVLYKRSKWSAGANYESTFSGGGNTSTLRNNLGLIGTRQLRSPHNFYLGVAGFQQNDEQQLDLRTTVGGGLGHVFRSTNNSLVAAFGGAVLNREHYSSSAPVNKTTDSAELLFGTQLNFFRFKTTNILVQANVYPSLTDLGRTRFDLNTSLKLRIAKDLYWRFGYYLNVDSRPPQNLPKTDYGSTSSLGWSF